MVKYRQYSSSIFVLLLTIVSITCLEYLLRFSVDKMSLTWRFGELTTQESSKAGYPIEKRPHIKKGEAHYRPDHRSSIEELALFIPKLPDSLDIKIENEYLYSFNYNDIYYDSIPNVIPLGPLITSGEKSLNAGVKISYELWQNEKSFLKSKEEYAIFIGSVDRIPYLYSWWIFFNSGVPLISLIASIFIAALFVNERINGTTKNILNLPFICILLISLYFCLEMIYRPPNKLEDAILVSLATLQLAIFTPLERLSHRFAIAASIVVFVFSATSIVTEDFTPLRNALSTCNVALVIAICMTSLSTPRVEKKNIRKAMPFVVGGLICQPIIADVLDVRELNWVNSASFAIFITNTYFVVSRWSVMKGQLQSVVMQLGRHFDEQRGEVKNILGDLDIKSVLSENERLTEFRNRIHSDLHDGVLTNLSVLAMQLKQNNKRSNSKILEQVQKTSGEVRFILEATSAGYCVRYTEFASAVLSYINTYYRFLDASVKVDLNINKSEELYFFSSRHSLYLFRILQELLSNAVVHGAAKKIELSASYQQKCNRHTVQFQLRNEGGVSLKKDIKKHNGFGLQNILNRCDAMGFNFDIIGLASGAQATLEIELEEKVGANGFL